MQRLRQGLARYWSGVRLPINSFLHRRRGQGPGISRPASATTYEDKMMRTRYPLDTYQAEESGTSSAPEVPHG